MCLFSSCCFGEDGNVDYHFKPPFSYHSIRFTPVKLDNEVLENYIPKSFYKQGKRFRGLRAYLMLKGDFASIKEIDLSNYIEKISIVLNITNTSDKLVFKSEGKLSNFTYKKVKDRRKDDSIKFSLKGSDGFYTFNPNTDILKKIELKISFEGKEKHPFDSHIFLQLEEIRGK